MDEGFGKPVSAGAPPPMGRVPLPPPPPAPLSPPAIPTALNRVELDLPHQPPEAPAFAGVISKLADPLAVADDQPPPPGSHWTRHGWHAIRRYGWKAVDVLPKSTTTAMQALRLTGLVLVWMVIVTVALEVLVLWMMFVWPFQAWSRRKRKKQAIEVAVRVEAIPHQPPVNDLTVLARAPRPAPAPATNACSMCGGTTSDAVHTCLFCGAALPVVAKEGWYMDPLGADVRRWFDGSTWSEHTTAVDHPPASGRQPVSAVR